MELSVTPLVLLPGMMCDARLFLPQISELSADYTLQVAPITRDETIEALAREVLRNAPPIFALAGLSMGGIVAMEMMRLAPERIDRIALLDTNHKAELPDVKLRREPQIEQVRAGNLHSVMRDEMKPNYLSDGPCLGQILDVCMAMAESLGAEVFERQSRALQNRIDQQQTLKNIQVPSLVLCGEDDTLCPPARHEMMHELIPNSRLEVIKGAGHLPTLEQAEITTKVLREWMSR